MVSIAKACLLGLGLMLSACAQPGAKGKFMSGEPASVNDSKLDWARGIENQRKADLGNGYYLNPIISGDHPDPSVLKDGDDYYMTHSSFDSYPGLLIWHSKDLINWQPLTFALTKNVGSVWAPELTKYQGKYYIYLPSVRIINDKGDKVRRLYVLTADQMTGPWSEPQDIGLLNPAIDPGHIVGEDGKRYLFMAGGNRVQLSDDGLSAMGEMQKVYEGWQYPQEWDVESFSQEGPKMLRHGEYFYMVLAEGGTAGPPTGHMVVVARSRSIHGPWENAPNNPVVRTVSREEKWWSRGHATPVEGPDGQWYMMYHGYENGYYNLGRQTLLEPIEWTSDGWVKSAGFDVGKAIPKPVGGSVVPHGMAFSDDFSTNKFGLQWSFYLGGKEDNQRVRYENGAMVVKAKGSSPRDSSPLSFLAGDQAYQFEVEIETDGTVQAGVLLFYNKALYAGLGYNARQFVMHRYGQERNMAKPEGVTKKLWLRVTNNHHILTIHYSSDGVLWRKFPTQMEVSGYHHNVAYDFLSLRPALYVAGEGEARFRNFKYMALR